MSRAHNQFLWVMAHAPLMAPLASHAARTTVMSLVHFQQSVVHLKIHAGTIQTFVHRSLWMQKGYCCPKFP